MGCFSSCSKFPKGEIVENLVNDHKKGKAKVKNDPFDDKSNFIISVDTEFKDVVGNSTINIAPISSDVNSYQIILLGDEKSGKTTFMKNFLIKLNKFNDEEQNKIINEILLSLLTTIQKCVSFLRSVDKFPNFENEDLIDELNENGPQKDIKEFIEKIISVWNDPLINDCYEKNCKKLDLPPYIPFFISKLTQYSPTKYRVSEEEILKLYSKTTKFPTLSFAFEEHNISLRDSCGDFRKFSIDPNFDTGLFFVPIGDYDEISTSTQNPKIIDSINLYKETVAKLFKNANKSIFIIFTKYDLFLEKIKNDPEPFSKIFPESSNLNEDQDIFNPLYAEQCQNFLAEKFEKESKEIDPKLRFKVCISINSLNSESIIELLHQICKYFKH